MTRAKTKEKIPLSRLHRDRPAGQAPVIAGAVPFLLAGGDPNWVPRAPVMGFRRFEPEFEAAHAPRSRRGRRAGPAPVERTNDMKGENDFE